MPLLSPTQQAFLDTRTTSLLTSIQTLVSSIRTNAPPPDILDTIVGITTTTSQIIKNTAFCVSQHGDDDNGTNTDNHPAIAISQKLADGVERLEQKGREGEEVQSEDEWIAYVKGLPPLAFGIAREVKELGSWVEGETGRAAAAGGNGSANDGEEFA